MSETETSATFHVLQRRAAPARLSLVVPMYNEEAVFELLKQQLSRFAATVRSQTEVVLVNDGSSDRTIEKALAWAQEAPYVKVIHLSRNFGHQVAATAGLDHATGDAVVLLDADLQDPLEVIYQMIDRYCEGYDVVYGQREQRKGESRFKLLTAWAFYRIMRILVYKSLPVDTGDFRLMSRECLQALQSMRETHRFLRGMVAWIGFPQCAVRYERAPRAAGTTKYPLRKMLGFAWTAASSFSTLPLQLSIILGLIVGAFGIEEAIRACLAVVFGWYTVPGWRSLMVVTSVIGSALLISVGVVGQYVGRIYEESKDRPLYVVARTFNTESRSAPQDLSTAGVDHYR